MDLGLVEDRAGDALGERVGNSRNHHVRVIQLLQALDVFRHESVGGHPGARLCHRLGEVYAQCALWRDHDTGCDHVDLAGLQRRDDVFPLVHLELGTYAHVLRDLDAEIDVVADVTAPLRGHGPGNELGNADPQSAALDDFADGIGLCQRTGNDGQQGQETNKDFCHEHRCSSGY